MAKTHWRVIETEWTNEEMANAIAIARRWRNDRSFRKSTDLENVRDKSGFCPFQSIDFRMRCRPDSFTFLTNGNVIEKTSIEVDSNTDSHDSEVEHREVKPCFTYFVQQDQTWCIKIGIAQNVNVRIRSLQTASPFRLILLGTIDGDHEKRIHGELIEHKLCGEWFAANQEVMCIINRELRNGCGKYSEVGTTAALLETTAT